MDEQRDLRSEPQFSRPAPPELEALRAWINQRFDDTKLDAFCLDHFPEVYDTFSRGLRKDEKITLLLDHCRREPAELQNLDLLTRDEQPKLGAGAILPVIPDRGRIVHEYIGDRHKIYEQELEHHSTIGIWGAVITGATRVD